MIQFNERLKIISYLLQYADPWPLVPEKTGLLMVCAPLIQVSLLLNVVAT